MDQMEFLYLAQFHDLDYLEQVFYMFKFETINLPNPYSNIYSSVKWNGGVVASYGKIACYPVGRRMFMLINDPVIARHVYQHKIARNRFEPFLDTVSNSITFLLGIYFLINIAFSLIAN